MCSTLQLYGIRAAGLNDPFSRETGVHASLSREVSLLLLTAGGPFSLLEGYVGALIVPAMDCEGKNFRKYHIRGR